MKVLKISHTNCCQKFSKRRIFTQELTKVRSDANVTKKPCQTDILAFRHYLFALKNKIKITPDEKKALLKNKNMEFIQETLALLLQKLNIPENIAEQIEDINKLLEDYTIKIGSPFEYFDNNCGSAWHVSY